MAKRIIRLVHRIGDVVNNDRDIGDLFKVVFIPNYNVSLCEVIVPASDLSQHISTAGMEASGTSNMKFAMNGGLIIGTMDGANIEIAAEIDRECMFIFGAEAHEVPALRLARKTTPAQPYCKELVQVMADIAAGKFGPTDDVAPLLTNLKWENDYYLVSHDFPLYLKVRGVCVRRRNVPPPCVRAVACCENQGLNTLLLSATCWTLLSLRAFSSASVTLCVCSHLNQSPHMLALLDRICVSAGARGRGRLLPQRVGVDASVRAVHRGHGQVQHRPHHRGVREGDLGTRAV